MTDKLRIKELIAKKLLCGLSSEEEKEPEAWADGTREQREVLEARISRARGNNRPRRFRIQQGIFFDFPLVIIHHVDNEGGFSMISPIDPPGPSPHWVTRTLEYEGRRFKQTASLVSS